MPDREARFTDGVYLPKSSYTAFQLYHTTPECLNRDTRVVMIGSIPVEGAKRHRKWNQWITAQGSKAKTRLRKREESLEAKYERDMVVRLARGLEVYNDDNGHISLSSNPLESAQRAPSGRGRRQEGRQRDYDALRGANNSRDTNSEQLSVVSHEPASTGIYVDHDDGSRQELLPHSPAVHYGSLDTARSHAPHSPGSRFGSQLGSRGRSTDAESFVTALSHTPSRWTRSRTLSSLSSHRRAPDPSIDRSINALLGHDLQPGENSLQPGENAHLHPHRSLGQSLNTFRHSLEHTLEHTLEPLGRDHRTGEREADGSEVHGSEDALARLEPLGSGESAHSDATITPKAAGYSAHTKRGLAQRYLKSLLTGSEHLLPSMLVRKQRGEVLFFKRFLVQIREIQGPLESDTFTEANCPLSRLVDRWKEYSVVARYTGKADGPVAIYFYDSLVVNKFERRMDRRWTHSLKHKLVLNSSFHINIYSPLDMTLALWDPSDKKHTLVYLFKAQSIPTISSWLFFVLSVTGRGAPSPALKISVPDVNLEIEFPRQLAFANELLANLDSNSELVKYDDLLLPTASPSAVLQAIMTHVHKVVGELGQLKEAPFIPKKLGMAWRRFDQIMWIVDTSDLHLLTSWTMSTTHDLEMRAEFSASQPVADGESRHSDSLNSRGAGADGAGADGAGADGAGAPDIEGDLEWMQEPPPVEGFVYRLSTWSGTLRKQRIANQSYIHTHNQLLFYSSPKYVIPPLPLVDGKIMEATEAALKKLPVSYKIEPFGVTSDGRLGWIDKCHTLEDVDVYDRYALIERDRRRELVASASGIVDLTTIAKISPLSNDHMFEIRFEDAQRVLFRVQSPEVRDIWVTKLNALVHYWKLRKASDSERMQALYQRNLALLNTEEDFDLINNTAKWQVDQAVADPFTYTTGPMLKNRSVTCTGFLHIKNHKFASFKKYFAVLTPADLILYKVQFRSDKRFVSTQQAYYRQYSVLNLQSSYMYAGQLVEDYLIDRDQYFDSENPGSKALPRAYPNGWISQDTEVERCFILWTAKRSKKDTSGIAESGSKLICLAESRYDRDLWINALQYVLTDLGAAAEFQIV